MLQVINTMDKQEATEITNDIMVKAARDHVMYKSGFLTDSEITTRLNDVLPGIECASVVVFRGEEYLFVEHANYPHGAAAAALMSPDQTGERVVILNRSFVGSLEQLITTGGMSLNIVLHEIGHHIRGPFIPALRDVTSLYDLGYLYMEEEINTNNEVGADIYTAYLKKNFVGNSEAILTMAGGGILAYSGISKEMFNRIYNIVYNEIEIVKNILGPSADGVLDELEKNYKFWNK